MRRRDTLRKCAVVGATGGLGLLAGCTGGDDGASKQADLSKESFDFHEGESGNLVVTVTVKNAGTAEGSGRLYVTVIAAETTTETASGGGRSNATESSGNDGSGTESRNDGDGDDTVATREMVKVTVPAGETKTIRVPFEIGHDRFVRKGTIRVDLRT